MEVARVYDEPRDDSFRVLVDRLWPRGVRRDDPRVGIWVKDVAPSNGLRRWYNHEPDKYEDFARRYSEELQENDALEELKRLASEGPITLITSTKTIDLSHVTVLRAVLAGEPCET